MGWVLSACLLGLPGPSEAAVLASFPVDEGTPPDRIPFAQASKRERRDTHLSLAETDAFMLVHVPSAGSASVLSRWAELTASTYAFAFELNENVEGANRWSLLRAGTPFACSMRKRVGLGTPTPLRPVWATGSTPLTTS